MTDFASGPEKATDDQLRMGWVWFEYHAQQRIEILKFFVTVYGAMVATSAGFIQTPYPFVSAVRYVAAGLLALIFWQMDRRAIQLIEISERLHGERWIEAGFPDRRKPIAPAQIRHDDGIRYKHAFTLLFAGSALLVFGLFVFAVYRIHYLTN